MRVVVVERSTFRIGQPNFDVRVARPQRFGNAGQRAARTNGADETVNAAIGLLPDFGARGLRMGAAIGGVVELIGPDGPLGQLSV